MSYSILKSNLLNTFEAGNNFWLSAGMKLDDFTITYARLENSRDPENIYKLIEINQGFYAVYLVIKGEIEFKFHNENKLDCVSLGEKEVVKIDSGVKYEISGNGEFAILCFPGYNDQMYSHPDKPDDKLVKH